MRLLYGQHVNLAWDSVESPLISSYNIYRAPDVDSSFSLVATVEHPQNTYMDDKIEWDTHYYYVATSVDEFGMESGFSNRIDTTLQSNVPVELYSFSAHKNNSNDVSLGVVNGG
jgi:fibronectin type 3 domain-containing protein